MKKNKKKSGIAIVVVLFFAFAIGILMFFMLHTNTNLNYQTKQTLYELQANYLAHSALQFGKLQIYVLPKEIYDFYGNSTSDGNCLDRCDSDLFPSFALSAYYDSKANYDLFEPSKAPDNAFPYSGHFSIVDCSYLLSNGNMKMVQDSYELVVEASVSSGPDKEKNEILSEQFIVSRYSGR